MRWIRTFAMVAVVVLAASACLRVESTIQVNDDGSAEIEQITAVNPEAVAENVALAELDEADVGSAEEICTGLREDTDILDAAPAGAEISDYEEDGFCGARVTTSVPASDDLSEEVRFIFDDDVSLFRDSDTGNWVFEARIDTSGITEDTSDAPQGLAEALFAGTSVLFVVDLPGNAIDGQNNATTVDGGRFEWDVDIFDPPATIFAQTSPGGGAGGGGLGTILIIVVALAALAAAAWWFFTKRSTPDLATAGPAPLTPSIGTQAPPPAQGFQQPAQQGFPAAAPAPNPTPIVPNEPVARDTVMFGQTPAPQAEPVQPVQQQATPATNEPVFDHSLNAWVVHDPVRGKLVHDTATDTWRPA